MSDEAHEAQEPPMSAEDEERLRAFRSRAAGESARLAREALKQKAKHADLRATYGTEAVSNWYADHQAHLNAQPATGAGSSAPGANGAALAAAACGLRIKAVGESEAAGGRGSFTPVSPVGTPYDEAVDLTDEETETEAGAGKEQAADVGAGEEAAEAGGGTDALDALGAPVCGPAAGLPGVSDYQSCVLRYRRFEAWGRVLAAANQTPDSPLLQLLAADYLQAKAGGSGPEGDDRLAAAAGLPLAEREKGYLEALRASASADWERAYSWWLRLVKAYPSDLFAVKRAQFVCLMRGDAGGMLAAARAATPGEGPLGRYYYGLLAFGLEQTGQYERAEAAAREGLAGEFDAQAEEQDAWLQHGLAHALYFQARHGEALAFLAERSGGWDRDTLHPFLLTHLWWHMALLQVNALGLLVRLFLRHGGGPAPGPEDPMACGPENPRWAAVLQACEGTPFLHAYPLHNLLRLCALLIARRHDAPALLSGLKIAAAEAAAAGRPQLQGEIVPLAEALAQRLEAGAGPQEVKRARMAILGLRGKASWAAVGGSEEQRGFLLELAVGPVRAGKPITALGQAMLEMA